MARLVDQRETVGLFTGIVDWLQRTALIVAGVLGLAALLLVANTVRLAAFARRKEISIMRLVGASTTYIALPFLLEALVTAVLGVALAVGALAAFEQFVVIRQYSDFNVFPLVDWNDLGFAAVVVAIAGPVITLLPTLLLTRKYVKV